MGTTANNTSSCWTSAKPTYDRLIVVVELHSGYVVLAIRMSRCKTNSNEISVCWAKLDNKFELVLIRKGWLQMFENIALWLVDLVVTYCKRYHILKIKNAPRWCILSNTVIYYISRYTQSNRGSMYRSFWSRSKPYAGAERANHDLENETYTYAYTWYLVQKI